MKKWLRAVLILLLVLFIGIQFFRIDTTNPESSPEMDFLIQINPPEEVSTFIRNACYDCHSNETVYPWYAQVAPVSWMVGHHVEEGREHLNFSTWGSMSGEKREDALEEMSEEIREGEMPMPGYVLLHPQAKLSDTEKDKIARWAYQHDDD